MSTLRLPHSEQTSRSRHSKHSGIGTVTLGHRGSVGLDVIGGPGADFPKLLEFEPVSHP